jgi:pilus assembly protein CpaB
MTRGVRTVLVLVVALVAATAASMAAFRVMQQSAVEQAPTIVPVVVAARPVALGALITQDDVKVVDWPSNVRVEGTFERLDEVLDRGAITPFAANEPIIAGKLAAKGVGAGLPPTIPAGMRAISIKVNDIIGVAGFVVPGSRVDVLVTTDPPAKADGGRNKMTIMVAGNIQVLTAGTRNDQDKSKADAKPTPTSVVTLIVSPEDAERIALAQNQGQITLTLRNPLDQEPTASPGVRLASLLDGLFTPEPAAPEPAPQVKRSKPAGPVVPPPVAEPPKAYTVETIRGTKRTEETVK